MHGKDRQANYKEQLKGRHKGRKKETKEMNK
jgi:hypothetical protein